MLKKVQLCLVCALFTFMLSGCVVRTYRLTRDRVDQNLEGGNRGYLIGGPSAEELSKPRKATRTTRIVEIELGSPKSSQQPQAPAPRSTPVVLPPRVQEDYSDYTPRTYIPRVERVEEPIAPAMQKYTVQKGDTLQKISQKFFGTTKKYYQIYKANQDTLKSPNSIYPGQVINIPTASQATGEAPAPGLK
jgi:nucleoid-associated protein YgaU